MNTGMSFNWGFNFIFIDILFVLVNDMNKLN